MDRILIELWELYKSNLPSGNEELIDVAYKAFIAGTVAMITAAETIYLLESRIANAENN